MMTVMPSPKGANGLTVFHRSVTAPLGTPSGQPAVAKAFRRQTTMPVASSAAGTVAAALPTMAKEAPAAPARRVIMPDSSPKAKSNPDMQRVSKAASPPIRSWASMSEGDFADLNRPRPPSLTAVDTTPKQVPEQDPGSRSESDDELPQALPGRQLSRRFSWSEYPTTPLFLEAAADKPKATGTEPRIGIDIGGVLTREGDSTYMGSLDEWDASWEADGALDSVRKIVQVFGPTNTFLVSKVRPGGSMHQRMEQWLHETMDFCKVTGLPKENIVFVRTVDGPTGKGVVCEKLGISHFVDDKIEVLKSIFEDEAGNSRHLVERYQGLLFHFAKGGYSQALASFSRQSGRDFGEAQGSSVALQAQTGRPGFAALSFALYGWEAMMAAQQLPRYEQLSKLGVPASLGERMLLQAPKPQVEAELPAALRAEERIEYDKARYDFRAKLTSLLGWAGPHIGFGSFREGDTELEMFQAKEEVFSSFKYEKRNASLAVPTSWPVMSFC
ncbi:unnamed protein product [Effrenium voratum]|nr:unnamed protein product [Effrenium voratum]